MVENFGIIIACYNLDYFLAKGCCASIRYFLGDVPICLIVDGTFSVDWLQKKYDVQVVNHNSVSNQVLKKRSFGYGITKMIAFWESPWQHFLFLDADTVVWGNILKFADFKNFDVIIDKSRFDYSDEFINNNFFDTKGIEQYFPNFHWRDHRQHYFITGTFFGTRDIFELDEYIDILNLMQCNKNLFHYGEMGFLNFMLCRAYDEGKIRLGQENIQLIVPDFEQESLRNRFPVNQARPVYQNEDVIIHWCGSKPTSINQKIYSNPMSFSRRKFISDALGDTGLKAEARLKIEDIEYYLHKKLLRLYGKYSLDNQKYTKFSSE